MARRLRQCVVDGCERRAQMSQMVCKDHEGSAVGTATRLEVIKLEREVRALALAESHGERVEAAKRFRQRVERGDFASLFSGKFREMLDEAGSQEGLHGEIGALRIAMVRLLMEEEDPTRMAFGLSRVSNAVARAMTTQQRLSDDRGAVEKEIAELWTEFNRQKDKREEKWRSRWASQRENEERIAEKERAIDAVALSRAAEARDPIERRQYQEIAGSQEERARRQEAYLRRMEE